MGLRVEALTLEQAAERIGKSVRTLWRWQALGVLQILPGGYVIEGELLRAEAEVRRRRVMRRHVGATIRAVQREAYERGWRECSEWWMDPTTTRRPRNPYRDD